MQPPFVQPLAQFADQRGCTFATFATECRAKDVQAIPEDSPVFDFADEAGIPVDFIRLAWLEFKRRYGPGGTGERKRYAGIRGWRQHFCNAVRENWFKLWFFDGSGEARLTTRGIQAERATRSAA